MQHHKEHKGLLCEIQRKNRTTLRVLCENPLCSLWLKPNSYIMKTFSLSILYTANRLTGIFQQNKVKCITGIFIVCYFLIFLKFLTTYFITDYTLWTSLILTPYIIAPQAIQTTSKKYLWLALAFLLLTFISGVQTFYFLAIAFAMLFAIESMTGSIGNLPIFIAGLISPTFKYFNNMLGFPVRLTLSEWAGNIIRQLGYKVEVIGNVIIKDGTEFSVDPACVGLKMMAFSILTGLVIMAWHEKQTKTRFSFIRSSAILATIVLLNVIANLIRIVLLTIFKILPENPNHELIGILCLLAYVIIPSYFLIKWMAGKNKVPQLPQKKIIKNSILLNTLLIILTLGIGFAKIRQIQVKPISIPHLPGYKEELLNNDVAKLEKPGILMYIKPLSKFYGAEHNPMICWTGSGYQFSRISTRTVSGKEIYTGVLKKNKDIIYAAWWFDNGKHQTISQMDWRWRAIKGENFYLVNVNSGDKETLYTEVRNLLNNEKVILTLQ